jgi:hypothetical protein
MRSHDGLEQETENEQNCVKSQLAVLCMVTQNRRKHTSNMMPIFASVQPPIQGHSSLTKTVHWDWLMSLKYCPETLPRHVLQVQRPEIKVSTLWVFNKKQFLPPFSIYILIKSLWPLWQREQLSSPSPAKCSLIQQYGVRQTNSAEVSRGCVILSFIPKSTYNPDVLRHHDHPASQVSMVISDGPWESTCW